MKWPVFVCSLVCLARFCDAGALRCPPGATDPSCIEEGREQLETHELSTSEQTEAQCLAGTEWESNCHYCRCSDDGVAECLRQNTCDKLDNAEPLLCKPNTTFQRDCNTCVCLENGLGLCTLEFCRRANVYKVIPDIVLDNIGDKKSGENFVRTEIVGPNATLTRKVRALATDPVKACQPGQEFRMDCNKCLCNNDGRDFSCTRIDCNTVRAARNKRETSEQITTKCIPGSVFDRNCNVCRCMQDGQSATCTLKRCMKNELDSDVHTTDSDAGFRCNPGEQFKRDCNDCTCSADGKSVFCTLRLCDQDLTHDI